MGYGDDPTQRPLHRSLALARTPSVPLPAVASRDRPSLLTCRLEPTMMAKDCIEFDGRRNADGYGTIGAWTAHRLTWFKKKGRIPEGLHVLHTCDNPACINIDHLFLGTHQDNMADRDRKNRQARQVGMENGRARLTDVDVKIIKFLLREGKRSLNQIARCFNVCKSTIVHIKMGRIWSHIQ